MVRWNGSLLYVMPVAVVGQRKCPTNEPEESVTPALIGDPVPEPLGLSLSCTDC